MLASQLSNNSGKVGINEIIWQAPTTQLGFVLYVKLREQKHSSNVWPIDRTKILTLEVLKSEMPTFQGKLYSQGEPSHKRQKRSIAILSKREMKSQRRMAEKRATTK